MQNRKGEELKVHQSHLLCGWGTKSLCFCAKGDVLIDWFSFDNGKTGAQQSQYILMWVAELPEFMIKMQAVTELLEIWS